MVIEEGKNLYGTLESYGEFENALSATVKQFGDFRIWKLSIDDSFNTFQSWRNL